MEKEVFNCPNCKCVIHLNQIKIKIKKGDRTIRCNNCNTKLTQIKWSNDYYREKNINGKDSCLKRKQPKIKMKKKQRLKLRKQFKGLNNGK